MKIKTSFKMDTIEDISSTCENEYISNAENNIALCSAERDSSYDCESETEYDSENETIDICDNSDQSSHRNTENKNFKTVINPLRNSDKLCFFEQSRVIFPKKTFENIRNLCNNSETSQNSTKDSTNSVMHGKSKTFLIDSILGNNKNNSSKLVKSIRPDDSDDVEETTDEHNGKKIGISVPPIYFFKALGTISDYNLRINSKSASI